MIPLSWAIGGGFGLAALVGTAHVAMQIEHGRHVARETKIAARIDADRQRMVSAFNAVSGSLQQARQRQDTQFVEVRRDVVRYVPSQPAQCLTRDGVGLLDRAHAAANGSFAGQPASDARPATGVSAQP